MIRRVQYTVITDRRPGKEASFLFWSVREMGAR